MIADDIIIRPAEVGDVSRLCELWLQDVNYHIQFDQIWSLKEGAIKSFTSFTGEAMQKDDALLVVAESNETIIGFLHARVSCRAPVFAASKYVGIMDLAVEENFRNKGIGSKLIEQAEEWCRKIDIPRLEVHVATTNNLALGFYRKQGLKTYTESMFKTLNEGIT